MFKLYSLDAVKGLAGKTEGSGIVNQEIAACVVCNQDAQTTFCKQI